MAWPTAQDCWVYQRCDVIATCHDASVGGASTPGAVLNDTPEKTKGVKIDRLIGNAHSAMATVAARTQRERRLFMVCLLGSKNMLFTQCGSFGTLLSQRARFLRTHAVSIKSMKERNITCLN